MKKMNKSREVLYYELSILKFKFFYIECIAAAINLDQPFYPLHLRWTGTFTLGTHTIPKLIIDIDKTAYYK